MDDEPLLLEIDIMGDVKAMNQMQAILKSVKNIQAPMNSAADKTQRLSRNLSSAVGPAQRLAKAITQLRVAQATGSNAGIFDAHFRAHQAQKSFSRAQSQMNPQSPSFGAKLVDVLKSSRVGLGGGGGSIMPLVGKTLELLGPEVVLATAAIAGMAEMATAAAESLTKFRESMITSGGNAGEVGRMNSVGGAAGIGDMAGLSRQLADKLANDGQASAFGQNAGVHDYGGAFSQLDKMKNLEKVIDHIVNLPHTAAGDMDAAREARVLGLESALKLRDISKETYEHLKSVGNVNAGAHGPQATAGAAEFNAQMSMAQTNFDTLSTDIGSTFLPVFTDAIGLFNDFAPALHDTYLGLKPIIDLLLMASPAGMLAGLHKAIEAIHKLAGDDDKKDAEKEHTEALRDHAAALRNGTYGGGNRARGALPSAWGGSNSANWDSETRKLGAL